MANKKGAGGVMRGTSVRVALLFERAGGTSKAPPAARSSQQQQQCAEQHQMEVASSDKTAELRGMYVLTRGVTSYE